MIYVNFPTSWQKGGILHPWPFQIDKITLLFRAYGYVGFLVWGLLIFLIISWKINSAKYIKTVRDDAGKRRRAEKILKFMNFLLYLVMFQLIISVIDVLLMAIGIFNPARLPFKAIIMASVDVPVYFIILFSRFMISSISYRQSAES